ncbi:enolase C-terminal domain-like protein [Streptomyces sp. NPDC059396]|uniref:enolase C-terminal domain-like protein n=1 Tax=Streptomyces sp. NPDC059396 TaxID=3346819 RepID=UPI0036CF2CA2
MVLIPKTVIHAVRAWRLEPQPPGLPDGLPPQIADAAVAPAGPAWAEHRARFALELVGDGVSGWHAPISAAVWQIISDDHAAGLIGHDATQHRRLPYRKVTGRHRAGAHARAATSAVELACWDLASAASGRSVPDLLGGAVRASIPAYASALGLDPAHPGAPAAAAWMTGAGFWGQKWPLTKELISGGPTAVAAALVPLREAAGDGRFMVDGLGRCRLDDAIRLLPVLADLKIVFAEELLPPGSSSWARLQSMAVSVPLAAGEHAVDTHEQARLLLGRRELDVWQPDPGWSGGLAQAIRTTDLAADLGLSTFPHGAHLPAAVALAAVNCRDRVPAVEYHLTVEPLRQQIYATSQTASDGQLAVRTDPGLAGPLALADRQAFAEVIA